MPDVKPKPSTPTAIEVVQGKLTVAEATLSLLEGRLAITTQYQDVVKQQGKVEELRELLAALTPPSAGDT